jgi:hypothetical protein
MGMKFARFVTATLMSVTLAAIVESPTATAITYGDPVENPQVEFPEVVPVWVGGKSLCSGTLVTQQVVLTAAHCVYGQSGPFQISVGGSTLNNGRLIDIDSTWYHPRYDAALSQNDIALLHLKTPATVSRLGVLPGGKLKSLGKKFLIVGWGRDQNNSITGKLNRLSLNEETTASKKFFKGIFNPKTMIGAGRYFPDEVLYGGGCTGDSGGPLYQGASGANRIILGLTSFGARGCTVYQPTVFTRVDFYVSEINKGIQLLNTRAAKAPISSGPAAPAGVGPTTTTTTTPPLPLTLTCTFGPNWERSQGFSADCSANLYGYQGWDRYSPKTFTHLTKVCLAIDGRIPTLYSEGTYGKGVMFEYRNNFPYTAGLGCWSFDRANFFNITSTGNGSGPHTASITITDSIGRSFTTTFQFVGL